MGRQQLHQEMNIIEILRTIRYFKAALATLIGDRARQKLEKDSTFLKIDPENSRSPKNGMMKVTPSKRVGNQLELPHQDSSLQSDSSSLKSEGS